MTATPIRSGDSPEPKVLAAKSWGAYVNQFSGMVDEARRVMKGGGLSAPGVAENLLLSRSAQGQTS
jgi:hypothetical protein